jgi:hypothetical protein
VAPAVQRSQGSGARPSPVTGGRRVSAREGLLGAKRKPNAWKEGLNAWAPLIPIAGRGLRQPRGVPKPRPGRKSTCRVSDPLGSRVVSTTAGRKRSGKRRWSGTPTPPHAGRGAHLSTTSSWCRPGRRSQESGAARRRGAGFQVADPQPGMGGRKAGRGGGPAPAPPHRGARPAPRAPRAPARSAPGGASDTSQGHAIPRGAVPAPSRSRPAPQARPLQVCPGWELPPGSRARAAPRHPPHPPGAGGLVPRSPGNFSAPRPGGADLGQVTAQGGSALGAPRAQPGGSEPGLCGSEPGWDRIGDPAYLSSYFSGNEKDRSARRRWFIPAILAT